MRKKIYRTTALALLSLLYLSAAVWGQTTGSITGSISDQNKAAIAGANVSIKSDQTGTVYNAVTTDNGTFVVPALGTGTYQVRISANNFKQSVLNGVKVDIGTPTTINVSLEVGQASESVTVTADSEVLVTQSANVGQTIVGRQIVEQPQSSRDALDLVTLLPGVQTTGRPRTSTVNGLPKGALNISIDGVDVQDNLISSNDGFFTFVRPRIDAIQEVSVSTATPGAESNGEGAVQIKFVTQRGTNEFHGGGYWYHRQKGLNANYFFNNQNLPPDPVTGEAPRLDIRLNQYGGKLGGPLPFFTFGEGGPAFTSGKDKAFFFVNYEEFKLPEQAPRTRTILDPIAQSGIFRYGANSVNLLNLAAANGLPSTIDPTIGQLLSSIRSSTGGSGLTALDLNRQSYNYVASASQQRYFTAVRLDFNLTKNDQLENVLNYQKFDAQGGDLLNNADPAFLGFPNFADQTSDRWSNSTALRSTLSSNLVNEARLAFLGGTSIFGPITADHFSNQGGSSFTLGFGLTDATSRPFGVGPTSRSTPGMAITDSLTWIAGNHTLVFGGGYNVIKSLQDNTPQIAPAVTFGIATGDPANAIANTTNFPGASAAELANAGALYALLTGRVISVNRNAYLNDGTYNLLGDQVARFREPRFSLFVQDTWRARPNLSITAGVRFEPAFPVTSDNSNNSRTTYAGLFGVSGVNNFFKPGTLQGQPTTFTQLNPGEKLYNTDYNNFAPSFGISWNPNFENGVLKAAFGGNGESVFRAGYSMAFVREGLANVTQTSLSNPGGVLAVNRVLADNSLPVGSLLRDPGTLQAPSFQTSPTFPRAALITDTPFGFEPDLKTGVVHSWTAGIQRALNKNTVLEVRYVGTRGDDLWRRVGLNEINLIENGFLSEFRLAQQNFFANRAAGRGNTFAFFGTGTGTSPLPSTLAFFSGLGAAAANNAANYTSSFFANPTFFNTFSPNAASPGGFAGSIVANPNLFRANGLAAGLPSNFFVVNPGVANASLTTNGIDSAYDALQIDVRRRLSRGLIVQANYTFSKSFTNAFASSQTVASQPPTLRPEGEQLENFRAPQDLRHGLKASWIYELPFGKGQPIASDVGGLVNALIGGFEFHGTARVQSGRPFSLGNVQLVGITREELQNEVRIRKSVDRSMLPASLLGGNPILFLPEDIIINTVRAFNTSVTTPNGFSTTFGAPTGRYIAPATSNGCLQAYTGQCGFTNLVLEGPMFTRFDLSLVKKIRFGERTNLEVRGEFLNAFNNINFLVGGSAAADVAAVGGFAAPAFGRVTTAYQDISTTNDPGGRLVQLVLRLNF